MSWRGSDTLSSQTSIKTAPGDASGRRLASYRLSERVAYAGAVVVGAACIVIACFNQPYNQNEIQQITPYGGDDISKIIHATRQPPLDPLLGAAVQHLVGTGQLRQRLVPAIAGILALVVMALLLHRLRLGAAGLIATWAMATTPLLVRYSAYARPYALPMMLMLAYVYAAERFTQSRDRRWLALLGVCAAAMPATRVPEPNVFLGVTLVITAWRAWRRGLPRPVAIPLVVVPVLSIALVGYPLFHTLAGEASAIWDPSPSGVIDRFPEGVHETFTGLLPLLSHYSPWWPVFIVFLVAVVAIPQSRRQLAEWWFFWPLLAAPLVFAVAYHFMNPFPFDVRPYRARLAIFFVPVFVLMVAALARVATSAATRWSTRSRAAVGVLLAALVLTQLPNTARVLTENEAPDFQQVADVLTHDIPSDSIVLYDTLSVAGQWRQPFSAKPRYMGDTPYVGRVWSIMKAPGQVPDTGPVYVLLLDSECSTSVVCDGYHAEWDGQVDGWHVVQRFDRFTLYRADHGPQGVRGVLRAMTAWGHDLGPTYGFPEIFVAASLLKHTGDGLRGRRLVEQMYGQASGQALEDIKETTDKHRLDPFM